MASGVFLDLKFHDIPKTVGMAVKAAAALPRVKLLTIHTLGGAAMMRAAREAVEEQAESQQDRQGNRRNRPKLLGVTILTSLEDSDLAELGFADRVLDRAVGLAMLAQRSGLDGVVASGREVAGIREACGPEFLIVVPGIRLGAGDDRSSADKTEIWAGGSAPRVPGLTIEQAEGRASGPAVGGAGRRAIGGTSGPAVGGTGEQREGRKEDDQARVMSPGEVMRAGADYLVVGRPITAAADPVGAARKILAEMGVELERMTQDSQGGQ